MMSRLPLVLLALTFACTKTPQLVRRAEVGPIVIHDVAILDVVTGTVTAHRDVRIEGDRIAAISPTGPRPTTGLVIDGAGKTLMPGLIDFHGHTGSNPEPPWDSHIPNADLNMQRFLYAGVTRVLDPGGFDDDAFEIRADAEAGERIGPRLFIAGPLFTAPGGHPVGMVEQNLPGVVSWYVLDHMTRQVATPEEARAEVQALLPRAPDVVKVVFDRIPLEAPRLETEVGRAIIAAAKEGGVRAVAHIGTTEDALDAAEAGIDAWIHGVYKERISDEDVARLAAYGIPMAPTLVVFDSYATLGREPRTFTALEEQIASREQLARYHERPADFEVDEELLAMVEVFARQREDALDNVRRLYAAGVTILAGSDAQAGVFHGAGLHRELHMLERAGVSRIDVLRSATLHPARWLSASEDPPFGVVAPGKDADLLLVDGDPIADLDAVSRIVEVIQRGQRIQRTPIAAR